MASSTTSITWAACLEAMERFHNDGPHTLYCEAGTIERLKDVPEFADGKLAGMKIVIDPDLPRGVYYLVSAKAKPPVDPLDNDPFWRYRHLRLRKECVVKLSDCN